MFSKFLFFAFKSSVDILNLSHVPLFQLHFFIIRPFYFYILTVLSSVIAIISASLSSFTPLSSKLSSLRQCSSAMIVQINNGNNNKKQYKIKKTKLRFSITNKVAWCKNDSAPQTGLQCPNLPSCWLATKTKLNTTENLTICNLSGVIEGYIP